VLTTVLVLLSGTTKQRCSTVNISQQASGYLSDGLASNSEQVWENKFLASYNKDNLPSLQKYTSISEESAASILRVEK
jgi:hypothetical protein